MALSEGAIIGIAIGSTVAVILLFVFGTMICVGMCDCFGELFECCDCCECCECCDCECCDECNCECPAPCEACIDPCNCEYVAYAFAICCCSCCISWSQEEKDKILDNREQRRQRRAERAANRAARRRGRHHGDGGDHPPERKHAHEPVPVAEDKTKDDREVIQFHEHHLDTDARLHGAGDLEMAQMPAESMPTIAHQGPLNSYRGDAAIMQQQPPSRQAEQPLPFSPNFAVTGYAGQPV